MEQAPQIQSRNVLDISWNTILRISLSVFAFYIIYQIRDILIWSFLAFLISILFDPLIDFLQKLKIPRIFGVIFIYSAVFGLITLLIYYSVPIFVRETGNFVSSLEEYFNKISGPLNKLGFEAFKDLRTFVDSLGSAVARMSSDILKALFSIFGGIFSTFFIISVATFFSFQEKEVEKFLILLFPKKNQDYVVSFWGRSQKKLSFWLLSIVIASLFITFSSYIVLILFQVEYPLLISIFAGILNIIPIIGPIITGILILFIVSLDAFWKAAVALVAFVLIQQVENNIITPILTKKMVGISPALVIISVSIGASMFGFAGALLAVPVAGIISDLVKELLERRRLSQETPQT